MKIFFLKKIKKNLNKRFFLIYLITSFFFKKKNIKKNIKNYKKILFNTKIKKYLIKIIIKKYE